jgi:hypothetical protein
MYHGPRSGISAWFASLGYQRLHGEESDWLLDLVATGFDKPQQLYGNALMASADIAAAAQAFLKHYLQVRALRCRLVQDYNPWSCGDVLANVAKSQDFIRNSAAS